MTSVKAVVQLSDGQVLRTEAVPIQLYGLSSEVLRDPAAALDPLPDETWRGIGFWDIVDDPHPAHDPLTERLAEAGLAVDHNAKVVRRSWQVGPRGDAAQALAEARQAALQRLADDSEAARLRWITAGAGKAQAYQRKAREIDLYDSLVAEQRQPTAADLPWMADRVAVLTAAGIPATLHSVRDDWAERADAYDEAARQIERLYEAAVLAVQAAQSSADLAVFPLPWPEPPIG